MSIKMWSCFKFNHKNSIKPQESLSYFFSPPSTKQAKESRILEVRAPKIKVRNNIINSFNSNQLQVPGPSRKEKKREKTELVFIPSPGVGHLIPTTELAKRMVARDDRLSVTILVMKLPFESKSMTGRLRSLVASISLETTRVRFIDLPTPDQPPPGMGFFGSFVESQKPRVKDAVSELLATAGGGGARVAGLVLGMFTTPMIDVANELGLPCYLFYASSAAALGLALHMLALIDDHGVDTCAFRDSEEALAVPSFSNRVPPGVLPSAVLKKEMHKLYFDTARRFKETKGILVNTCFELEPYAVGSFAGRSPPVYPVGPVVRHQEKITAGEEEAKIIEWLDLQPKWSVVFLCFGSMGSFEEEQVKEIAIALERSGSRFLWSLREAPPKGKFGFPGEYSNVEEALPEGFPERTAGVGMVTGWVPQAAILAHEAVGGFVSHCGWNSTLESLWFGVPTATWPLFSEQQLNAFELTVELGLAVEVKMDYRREGGAAVGDAVGAEEIERGIRLVMEEGSQVRERVKEMSATCKRAVGEGGSSLSTLDRLVRDVV